MSSASRQSITAAIRQRATEYRGEDNSDEVTAAGWWRSCSWKGAP